MMLKLNQFTTFDMTKLLTTQDNMIGAMATTAMFKYFEMMLNAIPSIVLIIMKVICTRQGKEQINT